MEVEKRSLTFSVSGDIITKIAREWLFDCGKPYSVVEDLLLSCMEGTDQTIREKQLLAQDILLGRAEFQGNSASGDFCYVTLDKPSGSNIFEAFSKKCAEVEDMEKAYIAERDRYQQLVEALGEWRWGSIKGALETAKDPEVVHLLVQIMINCGLLSRSLGGSYTTADDEEKEIEVKSVSYSGSPLLDSYIAQQNIEKKFDNNYGWLEPDGTFHSVGWCDHQQFAWDTIQEKGWEEDFDKFTDTDRGDGIYRCGDFLTFTKGWVLLHNPGRGVAFVTRDESKRLTKAQREFLFNYYFDRGKKAKAAEFLEDT